MPRVAVMASAPMSAAPDTALTTAFLVRCAAPTVTAWRLLAGPTKASDTLLDSMALASMPVRPPSVFVRASLPFTFREERRFVRLAIARLPKGVTETQPSRHEFVIRVYRQICVDIVTFACRGSAKSCDKPRPQEAERCRGAER